MQKGAERAKETFIRSSYQTISIRVTGTQKLHFQVASFGHSSSPHPMPTCDPKLSTCRRDDSGGAVLTDTSITGEGRSTLVAVRCRIATRRFRVHRSTAPTASIRAEEPRQCNSATCENTPGKHGQVLECLFRFVRFNCNHTKRKIIQSLLYIMCECLIRNSRLFHSSPQKCKNESCRILAVPKELF